MDGVLAVGVVPAARAAAEHLAHEVGLAVEVGAVDAGVADRLLVGGHPAAGGLGQHAGEDAEQPQDHERPGVGRRREDRGEQRALLREAHLDQRDDALVDVELGHPLRRLGQVAQDRRQPLLQEVAVGVVAAVVDRALRLRAGAGEVDDQRDVLGGVHDQRDPLAVQLRLLDAVVLGVVLPDVGAVRDLATGSRAGRPRWSWTGSPRSRPRPRRRRSGRTAHRGGGRRPGRPSTRRRGRRPASRASASCGS